MRVVEINSICGHQSTGRIVSCIRNKLIADGHDCVVAYGERYSSQTEGNYHIGSELDRYIHALRVRLFDQCGFGSIAPTKRFINWMDEYDPDIIHIHNLHGYYINLDLLFTYLKNKQKKVIWTLHDCWAFTGHCPHFERVRCNKWKEQCFKCPLKSSYPASFFWDSSFTNYKKKKELFTGLNNLTIVTPSIWLANLVKESFLGKYEIKTINNGIDLNVFKPTDCDFIKRYGLENRKIVLSVSNIWTSEKGLNDIITLSKMLPPDFVIVIVGLSVKQIKTLPKTVIGIERTRTARELAGIYSSAEVFVNPTYEDNYPTVNLEAQACGTPVITYKTGGSVESASFGGVVEQGNLEHIRKIILEGNISPRKDIDFDVNHMIERYISLFKSY